MKSNLNNKDTGLSLVASNSFATSDSKISTEVGALIRDMVKLYRKCKQEDHKATFWLRESIYNLVKVTPMDLRPKNIPIECDGI